MLLSCCVLQYVASVIVTEGKKRLSNFHLYSMGQIQSRGSNLRSREIGKCSCHLHQKKEARMRSMEPDFATRRWCFTEYHNFQICHLKNLKTIKTGPSLQNCYFFWDPEILFYHFQPKIAWLFYLLLFVCLFVVLTKRTETNQIAKCHRYK